MHSKHGIIKYIVHGVWGDKQIMGKELMLDWFNNRILRICGGGEAMLGLWEMGWR